MSTNRELTAYRQATVQNASPVELVIILCDLLVRDLRQVIAAIRAAGEIEERVKHSNHAFLVLAQLESQLDMENGGDTAVRLARIYSHIRAKLLEVQLTLDAAVLESQIEFLLELRNGWQQAMPAKQSTPAPAEEELTRAAIVPNANRYANLGTEMNSSSWSA